MNEEIIVRLGLDQKGLEQGLAGGVRTVKGFASKIEGILGVSLGIGSAGAALNQFLKSVENVKALQEMSDALNVSVGTMQAWQLAVQNSGGSAQTANTIFARLGQAVGKAMSGSKEAVEQFNRLGISAESMQMTGGDLDDIFNRVADSLTSIPNPADRAAIAFDIFGKKAAVALNALREFKDLRGNEMFLSDAEVNTMAGIQAQIEKTSGSVKAMQAKGYANIWGAFVDPFTSGKNKTGNIFTSYAKAVAEQGKNLYGLATGQGSDSEIEAINARGGDAQVLRAKARKDAVAKANELLRQQVQIAKEALDPNAKIERLQREQEERAKAIGELTVKARRSDEEQLRLANLKTEQSKQQVTLEEALTARKKLTADQAEREAKALHDTLGAQLAKFNAEQAYEAAKRDRSGWTVGDVANRGLMFDRRGKPILPDDVLAAMQADKGRRLSRGEIEAAAQEYAKNVGGARDVMMESEGARLARLGGGGAALTDRELATRRTLGALTRGEADPLQSERAAISTSAEKLTELLELGKGKAGGLAVKPRMGK